MKRTPLARTAWQRENPRTVTCLMRTCKRTPDEGLPVCPRHAPGYLFEQSKLGELGPKPVLSDDPKIARFAQDAKVHDASRAQVVRAQAKYRQSAWRKACLQVRPAVCVAAGLGGCQGQLECDHVRPRSQGGPYVVENGSFLCSEHHRQKTDSELKYRREWLYPNQLKWLADTNWFKWDEKGQPCGLGWRHIEPIV